MPDTTRILVRNDRDQDIPAVVEIDAEASSPYRTAETPETFQHRLDVVPNGFFVLVADHEIAAYGCSEKRQTEQAPGAEENLPVAHEPDGRILSIIALGVKTKYQGRGYRLRVLDKLIEIAHLEGCRKVVVETMQAQESYQQRGFQTVRSRTDGGISSDVMSLELKSISRIP